jgi:chromosomal replication initiation ATPase DnaA
MINRNKEQPKSRKVKYIIEEVIMDTLLKLDQDDEMLALRAESIFNEISNKKSIKPYLTKDVVRLEEFTSLEKKEYYAKRLERLRTQPLARIEEQDCKIFDIVCDHFKLDNHLIRTSFKQTDYADARKMVSYLFYTYFKYTLTKIARIMNKDHSTIIHSNRKHRELMSIDKSYANKFYDLVSALREEFPEELGSCANEEEAYLKSLKYKKEKNYKIYIKKL